MYTVQLAEDFDQLVTKSDQLKYLHSVDPKIGSTESDTQMFFIENSGKMLQIAHFSVILL